jgi:hypothetical protein
LHLFRLKLQLLPEQVVTSYGDIYEVACSALLVKSQLQPTALLHGKSRPVSPAELLLCISRPVCAAYNFCQLNLQAATSPGVLFSALLVQIK